MKIRRSIFTAILIAIFFLPGCASESMTEGNTPATVPSTPEQTNAVASAPPVTAATEPAQTQTGATNSPMQAFLDSQPKTISRKINDMISVEADVQVPSVDGISVLDAAGMQFDEGFLLRQFFTGESPSKEVLEDDNQTVYTSDKKVLSVSPGYLSYRANAYSIYNLPLWGLGPNRQSSTEFVYSDVYKNDRLDSIDKAQAVEHVTQFLGAAGLELYGEPIVYVLDCKTMQSWQDQALKKNDFTEAIAKKNIVIKDILTTDDEAYLMVFKAGQRGVPVTAASYTLSASEKTIRGTTIEVCYSADGIISCGIAGAYTSSGESAAAVLMGVDDAIQSLQNRWTSIITNNVFKIIHISMEYTPVPNAVDGTKFSLVPSWVFTVEITKSYNKGGKTGVIKSEDIMSVNAVTGAIIE